MFLKYDENLRYVFSPSTVLIKNLNLAMSVNFSSSSHQKHFAFTIIIAVSKLFFMMVNINKLFP